MSYPPDRVGSGTASRSGPRGGEPGHVHHDGPGHRRRGAGHAGVRAGMQECALGFLAARTRRACPPRRSRTSCGPWNATTRSGPPSGAGCCRSSTPRTGTWPTGSAPPGPGWSTRLRVTKGQAAEYQAVQALARGHRVLHAALAEGWVLTTSEALQLARWTRAIPAEYRDRGRGHPGRRRPGRRGPARPGGDLRGDPGPHRRARPRRPRPAAGPRRVPGHHLRRVPGSSAVT